MRILHCALYLACIVSGQLYAQDEQKMDARTKISLERLMEGNRRFVQGNLLHPNRAEERRLETAPMQEPFAIVVGCSDSRVPPEIIFDQGLGDIFVVRVAGNVVGAVSLDSIEFSAVYLHSSLIFVMGHENCGAVSAVLEGKTKDIEAVASLIEPAIRESASKKGNRLENAIKDNVKNVISQLKESPVISKLIEEKKLTIAGGYYHFVSGEVELLD